MDHEIKTLAEAMTNAHARHLVENHVKALKFEENHLTIYVDNTAPLHEFSEDEMDHHLQSGMEKIYGPDITYELKLHKPDAPHEREKEVPHNIHQ